MPDDDGTILNILHLEDSRADAELISATLLEADIPCVIKIVKSREEFNRAIAQRQFDIILSDYSLPSFGGKEAFKLAHEVVPDTPFIFVSGTLGEDAAIQSLVDGATDYVLKSKLARLAPAVNRAMSEIDEKKKRKMAENLSQVALENLKKSEARFRGVLESAPDPAVIVNSDGKIAFANAQAEKVFAVQKDQLIGKPLEDLVPERFRATHKKLVSSFHRQPHARGLGSELELYGRRSDGTEFPADIMLSPLRMDGEMSVLAMIRDVSDSREAERALRESEARFRMIYEASPLGIMIVDEDGRIVRCNPAVIDLLGYSEQELKQKTYDDITHPEDRPVGTEMSSVLKTGKKDVVRYEKRYIRKDGKEVWVHITHSAVRDEKGSYRFGLGIIEDFTDRKRAEEALRRSEDRYRNLVESARDAIFSLSPSAVIVSLNPAFETMTGWKREEWIGKSVTDLIHPDDRSKAQERLRKSLEGDVLGTSRFRIIRKSGEYGIGEFNTTRLMNNDKLVGILGIARDVTSQIAIEEQLRQSQKMESLGTLAGGIAHDFNNILGIIMGYASLSRRALKPGDKVSRNLSTIEGAAQRGIGLIRQLLMFARRQDRVQELVDVNGVVADIYKMVKETFPKVISTRLQRTKDELFIYGDPTEIHQAVLNLCVNARDAMMDRADGRLPGGRLDISTSLISSDEVAAGHPSAGGESYVRIAVSDTGKGIDEATQKRIFEPFFTTKEKGKGTGLGLSTVYGIVSAEEGFVEVSSRIGEGTTFTVLLPSRSGSPDLPGVSAEALANLRGESETLLIVEDEEGLRELLYNILSDNGYSVLTAEDGEHALALALQNARIDLVISDLGLPKVGGLDLFEAIRKIRPNMKVILVSGFLSDPDRERMQENGVNGFVQKPYKPRDVLEQVKKVLGDRRA